MNQTIETLLAHRSIRAYRDEPVADTALDAIIEAAHRAPTSINAQALSVIVVRDPVKRARIAELTGGQAWIADAPVFLVFVLDHHKTGIACEKNGKQQMMNETVEGLLSGAVDVGIALGSAIAAAESMGLGIVPIGGVRKLPQPMIELLELPAHTFPLVGLVVGHPADRSRQKPRLDIRAYRHEERYCGEALPELIENYDRAMAQYLTEIGRAELEVNWTQRTSQFYSIVYYPEVFQALRQQGFTFER